MWPTSARWVTSHYFRGKLKIKAKHNFNIGFCQHSTFIKYKIGEKRTVSMCKRKVSICTLPDSLSLKVVWVCCTVLQLFSPASYFLHTESRHLSVHHGCRPFWGSEICSGAELVEVLSKKRRARNTHKKRHKNVFFSKTPGYKKSILK